MDQQFSKYFDLRIVSCPLPIRKTVQRCFCDATVDYLIFDLPKFTSTKWASIWVLLFRKCFNIMLKVSTMCYLFEMSYNIVYTGKPNVYKKLI